MSIYIYMYKYTHTHICTQDMRLGEGHERGVVQEEMRVGVENRGEKYDLCRVYAHMKLSKNKYNFKNK